MFTFGREHEKACAAQYVKGGKNVLLVGRMTDAVHDLLEQKITLSELRKALREAFVYGGSGVWEQAATWLRRLGKEHPDLLSLWLELSQHRRATVRFRIACCLQEIVPELVKPISSNLLLDTAKKVREMTIGKIQT